MQECLHAQMPKVLLLYLFRDAAIVSEPRILVPISCFGLFGSSKGGFPVPNSPEMRLLEGEGEGRREEQTTPRAHSKHQIKQNHTAIHVDCHFQKPAEGG